MKRVIYYWKGDTIVVEPGDVRLLYDGQCDKSAGAWSVGPGAFQQLLAQNPDVEFVEVARKD